MKKKAIFDHFKMNQAQLAVLFFVSQAAVSKWGEVVPEQIALLAHWLTAGALQYDPRDYHGQATHALQFRAQATQQL